MSELDVQMMPPVGAMETFIRRYAILPEAAYLPLAVWCAATYLSEVFDCFPYVALQSPMKRCGKTRCMEALELLCARSWRGTAVTLATLFRMMVSRPTLFLDEIEGLKSSRGANESQLAILAILNAGYRKGATVPRCDGPGNEVRHFPVYGPKVFAAIGGLPDTLSDRSIVVTLQRKRASQKVDRFLFGRAKSETESVRTGASKWAEEYRDRVRLAYESLPDPQFLSDRDSEVWMPLFALCAVAAPDRLQELHNCAKTLSAAKQGDDEDDSLLLKLLTDIRAVWPKEEAKMATVDLLDALSQLEDGRWGEVEISSVRLASWLRPLQIAPRQVRIGEGTMKGYLRSEMEAVWDRYLPAKPLSPETRETDGADVGEELFEECETAA